MPPGDWFPCVTWVLINLATKYIVLTYFVYAAKPLKTRPAFVSNPTSIDAGLITFGSWL